MENNEQIYDYSSFIYYQNKNTNLCKKDRIIQPYNIINNDNNYSNIIKNFNKIVNKSLLKENNFFVKTSSNNKSSKLINNIKKVSKLKCYYNNLIPHSNKNYNDKLILHNKNNKSLNNNQIRTDKMINYYSNIYINNDYYHRQNLTTNSNKQNSQKTKPHITGKKFNNNSFVSIYSYNNKKDKRCINKSDINILNNSKPIRIITDYHHQKNKSYNITKKSSSPYYKMILFENNNINNNYNNIITDYNYYNKIHCNNYDYNKNNIINFNENINYNNIKNILNNQINKNENSISKRIINYNNENNKIFISKNFNTNKTNDTNNKKNIEINIYPSYQQIKNNEKEITKMNLQKDNICLKCKKLKIKSDQNYNLKEPLLKNKNNNNNNMLYKSKNINSKRCYNNYNSSKTEQNEYLDTSINKPHEKINNEKLLSLVKKNYELFLKKNNQFNLKKIANNIKKRKRPKSKNQIDKEKNLDRIKSLSYRESLLLKPKNKNSNKKNKNSALKDIARTLSHKKYIEDVRNLINKDNVNNIKTDLFGNKKGYFPKKNDDLNLKINKYNKYNNINLEKQIGCQFSIYQQNEKNNNECLNGVITYFNSENLRNRKILY